MSAGEQAGYQRLSSQVLRCNVAQTPMGEDFRGFSCRLSESELLQWFCKMDRLDEVRIPGKSTLQRYSQWLPEADMRKAIDRLLAAAAEGKDEGGNQKLELAEALNLEWYFLDTTCVKLNMHFPVDWVLLRDAARTLMKATMLIRKRGLKVRMDEPEEFLKRMNQLCIKMTHARRKKDGKPLCAKISETPSRPAFSVGGGEGSTHEDEGKWCKWYCSASPRIGFAWRGAE